MVPIYRAKRGISPWLLPLSEAKHVAVLQGNSGQRLLALALAEKLCLSHTPTMSLPATATGQGNHMARREV